MSKLYVVTEPQSPFEALRREFPELKDSTVVFRVDIENDVSRTFRLPDGRYITIVSTKAGNKIEPVPEDKIEVFQTAWREFGPLVYDDVAAWPPHGIVYASAEFFQRVESELC